MDRKRSRNRDESLSDLKNNQRFAAHDKTKKGDRLGSVSVTDRHSGNNLSNNWVTMLQTGFGLGSKQSSWSNFGRGLFWGGIVGLTAVFSASCGMALTQIDVVEKAIARTIELNLPTAKSVSKQSLTKPINVLLIEVEPREEEIVRFSQDFAGKSKTILLLQFKPGSNTTKIINIPVNSRVKIPGFGWGTIDDANKYGGSSLVSQSVTQLLKEIAIDRYIRATPSTFNRLIYSGKIIFNDCDVLLKNCSDPTEKIARQQMGVETIRQRLNIPVYLNSFESTLKETRSDLDTNLSLSEAMSIANFVKELESDSITVDLVSNYTLGKSIDNSERLRKSQQSKTNTELIKPSLKNSRSFKDLSIAVQNTTENPELGMRFVNYLRRQNLQDVYLVEHIPLKLNKTKIIVDRSQLDRAKQLKNIIGFGKLEPKSHFQQKPLTIQIGEDARHLPYLNSTY